MYQSLKNQLSVALVCAVTSKIQCNEALYELHKQQVGLLQRDLQDRVRTLLLAGSLQLRPADSSNAAFIGYRSDVSFTRDLGSGPWTMRLVEISPDIATDTILGSVFEERPLFQGMSLQFTPEQGQDWIPYQPVGGARGDRPRLFALHLLELLPESSKLSRRDRAARALESIQQDRPANYDQLSNEAKRAFDGHSYLSGLRLYDGTERRASGKNRREDDWPNQGTIGRSACAIAHSVWGASRICDVTKRSAIVCNGSETTDQV